MSDTAAIHPLNRIFGECSSQAIDGKGKAHHAGDDIPFNRQVWVFICYFKLLWTIGQIVKKAVQADMHRKRGELDQAKAELQGVAVYAALEILDIEKEIRA